MLLHSHPRLPKAKIDPYDIHKRNNKSNPEAAAADHVPGEFLPVIPCCTKIAEGCQLQANIKAKASHAEGFGWKEFVSVFQCIHELVIAVTRVILPTSNRVGASDMKVAIDRHIAPDDAALQGSEGK